MAGSESSCGEAGEGHGDGLGDEHTGRSVRMSDRGDLQVDRLRGMGQLGVLQLVADDAQGVLDQIRRRCDADQPQAELLSDGRGAILGFHPSQPLVLCALRGCRSRLALGHLGRPVVGPGEAGDQQGQTQQAQQQVLV